ncbi:MAG: cobalamin-binding protein [Candidatus Rokubacteria bacterium]|nr:cobalamin-binding protein [Candidatus Rokubacteria bacterium]
MAFPGFRLWSSRRGVLSGGLRVYGTPPAPYPQRIVCLTAETVEVVYALGAGERVVGVSGAATRPPEARDKPKVGGFTTFRLDKILALEPDLVLAFSDLQADVVRDLVRAGVAVLALNQRSLAGVFQAILMIGGVLGLPERARELVADMQDEIRQIREFSSVWPDRPRVYFEEWGDPPIAGIRWVSELIEIAGGQDVFPELRERPDARGRVVEPAEVVRRAPQIVLASWCGKPVDLEAIRRRPGWEGLPAVREGRVYAVPADDILAPGPSLLRGLRTLHDVIQAWVAGQSFENGISYKGLKT